MKDNNKNKDYTFTLILIIIVAFLLRYYKANVMDLWADEGFSYWLCKQNFSIILNWLYGFDAHPPLFYFFLHWWEKFGDNPLFLRLPGIMLGTLSIAGVYLLAKELINKETGLFSAFLTAVSASHVYMCREIRMYVYLSFFVIFAYYFFVKLFSSRGAGYLPPLQSRVESRESENTGDTPLPPYPSTTRATARVAPTPIYWFLYTLFIIIAWYIHYFAIFVSVSHNIIALLFHRRINVKYWFYSQAAILICYTPWYKYLFFQIFCSRGPAEGGFIWNKIFPLLVCNFISIMVAITPVFFWLIFAAILLILTLSIVNNYENKFFLAVAFIGFFTPIVILFFKSLLTANSAFQERYFHYILPLYFIIVVSSFLNRKNLKIFTAAVVLIFFLSFNATALYNMYYVKGFSSQRWSEAASYLSQHYKSGDGIIVQSGFQAFAFRYYFREKHKEYYLTGNQLRALKEITGKHKRIWMVTSYAWQEDPQGMALQWFYKNWEFERFALFRNFIQSDADVTVILFSKKGNKE